MADQMADNPKPRNPTPLSAAERKRRSRAKLKLERRDYQKNENLRIEQYRKLKVSRMNATQVQAYQQNARQRKAASRMKKSKLQDTETSNSLIQPVTPQNSYKKPQSFGKAVKKTLRALPTSPRKKKAVVMGLAKQVGLKVLVDVSSLNKNGLPDETVETVKEFYKRSDIVYTMPGMKDQIIHWNKGKKIKLRKYYLTMYLREVYALFKVAFPNMTISFSSFCSLRPPNVLLMKDTPADQCKCKIHENFILKLKALKICYDNDWWGTILCNVQPNSDCWLSVCEKCAKGKYFVDQVQLTKDDIIKWYSWEKSSLEENNGPCHEPDRKLRKVYKEGCVGELIDLVWKDMEQMLEHVNTKRIQNDAFQKDKADPTKRVLQVDFAMSYSCEYQNEVQSALWSRQSVTLFTAAVIHNNKCQTYLICSDTHDKDKDTISAFLITLYDEILKENEEEPLTEIIWSDGPSSEFKNRFMIKLLKILCEKYKKNIHWKYFATAHGKGIVDGIGGHAKSLVRQKVMSKTETPIFERFCKCCSRSHAKHHCQTCVYTRNSQSIGRVKAMVREHSNSTRY